MVELPGTAPGSTTFIPHHRLVSYPGIPGSYHYKEVLGGIQMAVLIFVTVEMGIFSKFLHSDMSDPMFGNLFV